MAGDPRVTGWPHDSIRLSKDSIESVVLEEPTSFLERFGTTAYVTVARMIFMVASITGSVNNPVYLSILT